MQLKIPIYPFSISKLVHLTCQIVENLPFELLPETTSVEVSEGNSRKFETGDLC